MRVLHDATNHNPKMEYDLLQSSLKIVEQKTMRGWIQGLREMLFDLK
jgi:hypothetical protein